MDREDPGLGYAIQTAHSRLSAALNTGNKMAAVAF